MEEPEKLGQVFDRLQLWKEYEGIAMHFNDLIIKLRGQSLGGVAAVATLAAVVAKSDTAAEVRWGLLTGGFCSPVCLLGGRLGSRPGVLQSASRRRRRLPARY